MQTADEINSLLEPETGWRVEIATSPHDQTEFLRLCRKAGESWERKETVAVLPRDSPVGVIVACGQVAAHYRELGQSDRLAQFDEDDAHLQLIKDAEDDLKAEGANFYRITHHYDIGNQDVYVDDPSGKLDGKRVALYCWFKACEWFGMSALVSNLGIASALVALYGFRHNATHPFATTVDLYHDAEGYGAYDALMNDPSLHRDGLRELLAPHVDGCDEPAAA
ncbi:hypothetical protein [Pandoraea sp. ISTKB]|uniref:hypothetical protein n=1 Tax=Pandoraea sp. ISTKB TaxID=1586708 RepID=UPI0008465482|nr:hypothetical protein [Pandoraea sp. ISTKB]ODP35109.1 hypothetical protein A9762_12155 [Pandoraea sp. ISTKB]